MKRYALTGATIQTLSKLRPDVNFEFVLRSIYVFPFHVAPNIGHRSRQFLNCTMQGSYFITA